ncbi:MAG: glycosyltransferase, partial [Planctomycetaceae bacterium]
RAFCFAQHSVTPSYGDAEGTPNTIIEASAAALPVISTRHAGIPDVVVHGDTGLLVNERDVSGMAEHMVRLLSDREVAEAMGQRARQRVRLHFSSGSHIARLEAAIRFARKKSSSEIADLAKRSLLVGHPS